MSTVLLLGARGFIGRRIWAALEQAGHEVLPVSRSWAGQRVHRAVTADLTRDTHPAAWRPRLAGADVVINAAGDFTGSAGNPLQAVHSAGPRALFAAAAEAGVRRIIQLSALGAAGGTTRYFATKNEADEFLASLPVESVVLQPSLVFGLGGRSARVFLQLATLPLLGLPRAAMQPVQPVHVDDLVDAVVRAIDGPVPRAPVPVVGGRALGLDQFLAALRCQLGYPPARIMILPEWMVRWLGVVPGLARYLAPDALRMLAAGNTASAQPLASLLGRPPRCADDFLPQAIAPAVASEAVLSWMAPALQVAIAALWIWTGIVSLGLYRVQDSYALLEQAAVPTSLQPWALHAAALLDIAIGMLLLPLRHQAWIWRLQLLVIAGYTLIITIFLPQFWLHPYGPISKNIPLLLILYLLQLGATRRWNT